MEIRELFRTIKAEQLAEVKWLTAEGEGAFYTLYEIFPYDSEVSDAIFDGMMKIYDNEFPGIWDTAKLPAEIALSAGDTDGILEAFKRYVAITYVAFGAKTPDDIDEHMELSEKLFEYCRNNGIDMKSANK